MDKRGLRLIMKGLRFDFFSTSFQGASGFRKRNDMVGLMISRHNHRKNRWKRQEWKLLSMKCTCKALDWGGTWTGRGS